MKCSNCGANLSDDTKFCSYCGEKMEKTVSASSITEGVQQLYESVASEFKSVNAEKENAKKSIADKIKEKGIQAWDKLSTYGKMTTVIIIIFSLLSLTAFLLGKSFAAIIAILQIVIAVVALLMRKQIIKVPKNWLYMVTLGFSIILLIPYVYLFKSDFESIKKFKWSEIVLADILPAPNSRFGEILSNSENGISLDVHKINREQYNDYIEQCTEKGFTVDLEQIGDFFTAYDGSGYKLSLNYYESDSKMHINVGAPYQYGTFVWTDGDLAGMLPIPKSTTGEISRNDERGFLAYVANMSIDDFESYIALCADRGFIVDVGNTDKSYSAKNSEGYRLSVEYQGNNVICVAVDEPEYEVAIEVECVANWIFSKYDVSVYVNDILQGTIKHGASETFSIILTKGNYDLIFVSAEDDEVTGMVTIDVSRDETFRYKISCTKSEIGVDAIVDNADGENNDEKATVVTPADDDEQSDAAEKNTESEETVVDEPEPNLTIDNCPELADMLANKATNDKSYSAFAAKYKGKIIEFDGRIDNCMKNGSYKTRFDYLVSAGDYDPDSQIGPNFKFENVAYYDLNTDLDTVSVGLNVRIVAEVVSFDSTHELFYLKPVSVTGR